VAVRTENLVAQASTLASFPAPVAPVTTTTDPGVTTTEPRTVTVPILEVAAVPIEIDVPWYATITGLRMGAAAVFVALSLVLLLLVPSRRTALSALSSLAGLAGRSREGRLSELANKATLFAEDRINRGKGEGRLRLRLDQAGLRLREGEFLLLVFAVLLVAVIGGFLFGGIFWAVGLGAVVILAATSLIRWLGERRATAFRLQLPDSLQLISGSLRAGFGLNQAITAVANEQDAPASEEFARAQLEVHLGREIEDALRNMAKRVQSEDLPWVAEAIEIHREIGGDIADLLDQIASTVRERERIRGQIQVLSAEGRISGLVLVLLPFIIAGLTFSVAPEYLRELTDTTTGKIMLAGGSSAMVIGIFWIRRIVRLEY
jgi:tight adherence protein B